MVIQKLYMEHFGKFHNQFLELGAGINVIYGENESGKSTIHTFIKGMLFGIEKVRGREGKGDIYTRYLPWDSLTSYSGQMDLIVNQKEYRICRNFYKETKESKYYDLSTGREYKILSGQPDFLPSDFNKVFYSNTIGMEQGNVKTEKDFSIQLKNYMANLTTSGSNEVDIEAAFKQLKIKQKKLNDENTKTELEMIETHLDRMDRWEEELKEETLQMSKIQEEYKCAEEELQLEMGKEKEENRKEENLEHKTGFSLYNYSGIILLLIGALGKVIKMPTIITNLFILLGVIALGAGLFIIKSGKNKGKIDRIKEKEDNQELEIAKYITSVMKEQEQRILSMQEKNLIVERLEKELAEKENLIQKKKTILEKLREEEENKKAIDLAMTTIMDLSRTIHEDFGRPLNEKISALMKEITEGKYNKVYVDETLGIRVQSENYFRNIEQLSLGTMEQLYFALRIGAGEMFFSKEKLPLILDEIFAFFDDRRMRALLDWLSKQDRQAILFTCQKREGEYLKNHGIDFRQMVIEE